MDQPVRYERDGEIALVTIDNPPVNALGHAVRSGLDTALARAAVEAGVRAVVLIGAGRGFPAGADIREFDLPPREPSLPEVITRIEGSAKPVIAALSGTALGGGLELALGCHYRIALRSARLGFPEVRLGLLPGAGGTQRLPRLIGVRPALEMITGGAPVSASRAMEFGLVDVVVDDELTGEALAYARRLLAEGKGVRRVPESPADPADAALFEEFAARIARRARGQLAPRRCLEAVRVATEVPLAEGLRREREWFGELKGSDQSRALRHAFFAEREVARVPGIPRDTACRPIGGAAVVGAGTMGTGIAMAFANAGLPVRIIDQDPRALERGLETIGRNYEASRSKGRLSAEEAQARLARIEAVERFDALAEADLVVEAVFEDLELKREVFARLDGVCKQGAILATNTSTLNVDTIAAATGRAQDVIGLHFFSPANVMKLVEVVRGARSGADTVASAMALTRRLGKVGVCVGVGYGFVGNRMLHQRQREALALVEAGATPWQVDRVLYEFGFPMGPFAMSDLAGLDVGYRIRKEQRRAGDPHAPPPNWLDQLVEAGRLGQKSGAGVYRYEPGSRAAIADPEVEELLARDARARGLTRREVGDEEILERCLYVMVNEAARILEEGVAARALDVDVVWIHGYGFPAYRGGPLYWADGVGLSVIDAAVQRFQREFGTAQWRPAPLLQRLAAGGGRFHG